MPPFVTHTASASSAAVSPSIFAVEVQKEERTGTRETVRSGCLTRQRQLLLSLSYSTFDLVRVRRLTQSSSFLHKHPENAITAMSISLTVCVHSQSVFLMLLSALLQSFFSFGIVLSPPLHAFWFFLGAFFRLLVLFTHTVLLFSLSQLIPSVPHMLFS